MCLFFLLMEKGNLFCLGNINSRFIFLQQIQKILFCAERTLWYYFRDMVHSSKGMRWRLYNFTSTGVNRSPCVKSSRCRYAFLYWHHSAGLFCEQSGVPRAGCFMWDLLFPWSCLVTITTVWTTLHWSFTAYKFHSLCFFEKWELLLM